MGAERTVLVAVLRRSFNEITPDGFIWLGHISSHGAADWRLEQRMRASRSGSARAR